MTQNLLVVDWDYFFPTQEPWGKQWELWDWGHSEGSSIYFGPIWGIRAAEFDRAGVPRPMLNKEWIDWWERFNISEDAVLYYADSNVQAFNQEVRESVGRDPQVWLYDAHHDSGYGENRDIKQIIRDNKVTCEDWMVGYRLNHQAELHVRYPTWKTWAMDKEPEPLVPVDRTFDNGLPNDVRFDTVFVCRSGAWVPPWCDHDFMDFITDAPVNELYELSECQPRDWNEDDVKRLVVATDELQRRVEATRQRPQEPS
jgi:hypothetical protein